MSLPIDVTDASFADDVLLSKKPVLVDFWADWCGPCKMVAPVLKAIADEYSDKLTIAKVDIVANPDVYGSLGIMSIPTLVLYQDGKITKTLTGAKSKTVLLNELSDILR